MPIITIIRPAPGLSTGDRALALIQASPEGISLRHICEQLNRPASMVQRYLKIFIAAKKIRAQLSDSGMHLIYYPLP